MKLKRPLPPNRSYQQVKNHYLVEKSIAERLKNATREERSIIYATMYEELFSNVPDHPRLERRESKHLTDIANSNKFNKINMFLEKSKVFVEFAPGDCRFAAEVAKQVKYVYGIDISDQRNLSDVAPDNFKLVLYDGYNLDGIESNSIDIIFSDQLIEHIHPEDTKLHFSLAHRILKYGGVYVFRTPHYLTGPHDVSRYFSDEPEGFHLKEWTYTEINKILMDLNYSDFFSYWQKMGKNIKIPYSYFSLSEKAMSIFPKQYIRDIASHFIPTLYGVAVK